MGDTEKTKEQTTQTALIDDLVDRLHQMKAIFRKQDDAASAELFAILFRDKHRYCTSAKDWFLYKDGIWQIDNEGMSARADMKILGRAIVKYAGECSEDSEEISDKQMEIFLSYARQWLKKQFRDAVLQDSRDQVFFSREQLDQNPYLLNCKNCVLDFSRIREGKIKRMDHSPSFLLSKQANVDYDPKAKAPKWRKSVKEIMRNNSVMVRYLQKTLGPALIGELAEQKMNIFFGPTSRNGKSTVCETVLDLTGSYSDNLDPESIAVQQKIDARRASPDLASLAGLRFVVCTEPEKSLPLNSALLKKLTGGDGIKCRNLNEKPFTFIPQFTLVLNCNYLPTTSDMTVFSSDRMNVIEFGRHFTEKERNKNLRKELKEEFSGILNWLIEGLVMYYKEGYEAPDGVVTQIEAYKKESDKLGEFLEDKLIPEPEMNKPRLLKVNDIYPVYEEWARNNGYKPWGKQQFIKELKTKNIYKETGTIKSEDKDGKMVSKTEKRLIVGYSGFIRTDKTFEECTDSENTASEG